MAFSLLVVADQVEVRVLKDKEIKEVPRILGELGAVIAVTDKITVPKHPEMSWQ